MGQPLRPGLHRHGLGLDGAARHPPRRGADRGFVMSDHADWAGLNAAIRATGAERVFVTHGYTASFRRWLGQGYDAGIVATEYDGERGRPRPDASETEGMKRFAALFAALDATTRTDAKGRGPCRLSSAPPEEDRLWTVALFSGPPAETRDHRHRLRHLGGRGRRDPDWLFEDAYAVAGDLAETISLILPPRPATSTSA
jgi:hypothetical protein